VAAKREQPAATKATIVSSQTTAVENTTIYAISSDNQNMCMFRNPEEFLAHASTSKTSFPEAGWDFFDASGNSLTRQKVAANDFSTPPQTIMGGIMLMTRIQSVLLKVWQRLGDATILAGAPAGASANPQQVLAAAPLTSVPELLGFLAKLLPTGSHSHKELGLTTAQPQKPGGSRPTGGAGASSAAAGDSGSGAPIAFPAGSVTAKPRVKPDSGSWWHYMFSPHH
jgi:hypothetical protein